MNPSTVQPLCTHVDKLVTLFGYDVGVPRSLCTRHIQHARHTQFYAPTLASSKKEFGQYPALILRQFALSKGVGH